MDKTLIIMPAYNVAGQINKLLDEMGRYRNCLLVIYGGSCGPTGKYLLSISNYYSMQAFGLLKVCYASTCFSDVVAQEFSYNIFGFGKQKSIGN